MLEQILEGKIRHNYSFGKTTRFGVGGKVRCFFIARTEDALVAAIKLAHTKSWPMVIVGEGTNLVVSDGSIGCFVIRNKISGIKRLSRNSYEIGAGENWTKLVALFNKQGLGGVEKMYGVPGSAGGAVVGNAGCYGQEIKNVVAGVKVFDGKKVKWLKNKQCRFDYRSSIFKELGGIAILRVRLSFARANPLLLVGESKKIFKIRSNKFPSNIKCAGSYFKNIILDSLSGDVRRRIVNEFKDKIRGGRLAAATLIESVGMKGTKIGTVKIADYHGNLIINMGNGKTRDVIKLSRQVKDRVRKAFNIELEEEVRII